MEKFWKLLYYYCLGAFVLGVTYLCVMLFIAPRQDALKRGFIPCTEKLVIDIASCERGNITCPMKYLWHDMKCNTKVILFGFGAWIKREQKTPWANYLFEPVVSAEVDEELPYQGNVSQDMDNLESQHLFIEKKQSELEAAKNRHLELNEDIIISNPEAEVPPKDMKNADKEDKIKNVETDDINDEAFDEQNWPENTDSKTVLPQPEKDTVKYVKQKNAEHLNKEEKADEK